MKKFVLQWHLTHRCNLRCTHCYQNNYDEDISWLDALKIFDQFVAFCHKNDFRGHINFTGGEPLLSEHLYKLLYLCDQNNITCGVLTNGTLLAEEIVNKLSQYSKLSFVQVSIDGVQKTHDKIRGKGSFKQTLRGIHLLHKYHIQSMVSMTVHKNNYKEVKRVISICNRNNVDRFWLDRLVPTGSNTEDILSTSEYVEVVDVLAKLKDKKRMQIHTNRAIQFLYGGDCIYNCSAGNTSVAVVANGDLMPCRRLNTVVGNVLETPLDTLYHSEAMKAYRDFEYPTECSDCGVRTLCKGGAKCLSQAIRGTYNVKDINCYR